MTTIEDPPKTLTLWTHDAGVSSADAVLNYELAKDFDNTISVLEVTVNIAKTSEQDDQLAKRIVVSPENFSAEAKRKTPNLQLSFSIALANVLKTPSRATVLVRPLAKSQCVADYMVLYFRDQYISRSDMWNTACSLVDQCIYVGKRITSSSGIRAEVRELWRHGKRRTSGYISATTKPVFRSESARYLIFIQMSKEMWDFEEDGELFYNKAIDGFLPELFKRWKAANSHHLVSIVLFTRVTYRGIVGPFCLVRPKSEDSITAPLQNEQHQHSDFYKVVVDSVSSNRWENTLSELKRELHGFQRDVMLQKTKSRADNESATISGHISSAMEGNILEAINLAAHQFNRDHIDRDLLRTGTSMIFITAGSGVFEVDQNMLRLTGENLLGNGIGIDILCLSKRPLHVTPLFKYLKPDLKATFRASVTSLSSDKPSEPDAYDYILPYICEVSYYGDNRTLDLASEDTRFQARLKMHELQMMGLMENEMSTISLAYLHDSSVLRGQDLAHFSFKLEQAIELYDARSFVGEADSRRIVSDFANGIESSYDPKRSYNPDVLGTSVPSFEDNEHFVGLYNKSRRIEQRQGKSFGHDISPGASLSSSKASPHWSFQSRSKSPERRTLNAYEGPVSPKAPTIRSTQAKRVFTNPLTGMMALKGQPSISTLAPPVTVSSTQGQIHKPIVTKGFDLSSNDDSIKAPSAIPIRLKTEASALHSPKPRKMLTSIDIGEAKAQTVSQTLRHSPRDRRYSSTQTKQSIAKLSLEKEPQEEPAPMPWHVVKNPSDPLQNNIAWNVGSWRWAHISNRARKTGKVNWESMCAPAALPLTGTATSINVDELRTTRFTEHSYSIYINPEVQNLSQKELLREMINQRLDQGYQLMAPKAAHNALRRNFSRDITLDLSSGPLGRMDETVYLAHAEMEMHQIACDSSGFMIEVTRYVRKHTPPKPAGYNSLIWPLARVDGYDDSVVLFRPTNQTHNWNYVDQIMSGTEKVLTESVKFWKARFLLIPVEISKDKRPANMGDQFTDEEIRVAGINKICELIHKATYLTPEDAKVAAKRSSSTVGSSFQVAFTTLYPTGHVKHEMQHFPSNHNDSEVSKRSNDGLKQISTKDISLIDLANELQSDKDGIMIKDRLWHWRWYEASWVGGEFVNWLLQRTELASREDATKYAQSLMDKGLFEHVKKQHEFLDGFYLYRLKIEYSSKSSKSWFGSRKVTPIVPGRTRAQSNVSLSPVNSPVLRPQRARKTRFELTRSLRIDVDPHKKSYRPEFVVLHHDIVHNPENCFHIRLEWIAVTARLVEETIQQWARIAEKYGSILVEAPVDEACAVTQSNPFRCPLEIKLSIEPPMPELLSSSISQSSTSSTKHDESTDECLENKELWLSRVLGYWNFVLDLEAAHKFPKNAEVVYSWGRPSYKYTQYIHRTGMSLCQITPKGFLWLTNRLYVARTSHAGPLRDRERESSTTSHLSSKYHPQSISPLDPDTLRNNFKAWCQSDAPKQFFEDYQSLQTPASTPIPMITTPMISAMPTPQQEIKSLFDEEIVSLHG